MCLIETERRWSIRYNNRSQLLPGLINFLTINSIQFMQMIISVAVCGNIWMRYTLWIDIPFIDQQRARVLTDCNKKTLEGNSMPTETCEFSHSRCRMSAVHSNDTIVNQKQCLKRNDLGGNQTPGNFCYRNGADCCKRRGRWWHSYRDGRASQWTSVKGTWRVK